MGWKSTVTISREDAICKLQEICWDNMSNVVLSEALEGVFGNREGANYDVEGDEPQDVDTSFEYGGG